MALPAIPPLNFQSSSGAQGDQRSAFDASGFSVQYGGGGVPGWAIAALVVGAVWWLIKHHR
jgi:hypothetical protein